MSSSTEVCPVCGAGEFDRKTKEITVALVTSAIVVVAVLASLAVAVAVVLRLIEAVAG